MALVHPEAGQASHCHALADDELCLYALAEGHGSGPAAEAAAAAAVRACVRARLATRGSAVDEDSMRALLDAAATELHRLRSLQRAYDGMASSLAVLSLDSDHAVVGIVGDCVAFLDRGGQLSPRACGQAVLLGPTRDVTQTIACFERSSGDRILLAVGGVLEFVGRHSGRARTMSARALVEAGRAYAPRRDAGVVSVNL